MRQVTKIGKVTIRTIDYTPKFYGKYNETKAKCWLVLYNLYLSGDKKGLTARELANLAGVNLRSLYTLLQRWHTWNRVLLKTDTLNRWKIAVKGRKWLDNHQDLMPMARYVTEIEAHQAGL